MNFGTAHMKEEKCFAAPINKFNLWEKLRLEQVSVDYDS